MQHVPDSFGSFVLLVEAVQLQLSFGETLEGTRCEMVRFDFRPYAEEYAAVCTSVSKGASRLKKCGKQLRAAENSENRVEGQRLLVGKHHGRYVLHIVFHMQLGN